ncbi:membrane protein insertase YidC [Marinihelvus fidelis]|uniref:Membrane protein insertase YidC n=1 Tax=Marinihelvus fidelis TaxID=2613842 RepID=A0A5N0T9T1_9GAMM|nr:membrane protein insertase YidC [Marinihelvus fidelis]KAA9131488.1 membrane protein insertase YidC [Marinihelvus fidelis]
MANLRPVLLITLVFIGYLLWVEWQKDYGPQPQPAPASTTTATDTPTSAPVPAIPSEGASVQAGDLPSSMPDTTSNVGLPGETAEAAPESPVISVTTDVLELDIDPAGGTVVGARLLDYPVHLESPEQKVALLSRDWPGFHIAQSGLLSRMDAPNHTTVYATARDQYTLADGESTLVIPLTWTGADGIRVTKTFTLERGSYEIGVTHRVENQGAMAWAGNRYEQLQRAVPGDDEGSGFNNPERYSFKGVGIYSPDEKLEKLDFDDAAEEPYQRSITDGWLAMMQHYFVTAWIPPAGEADAYSTQGFNPGHSPRVIARAVSPGVSIEPGQSHEFSSRLFVGPKLQDHLSEVAPGLDLTVNYGIFTVISAPLFWLLEKIHDFVGNWGWAIVILTILIKLAFFKLTEAQYRSMARMRKLQPRIEKLKERYGDDRQAMSQAMMKMYKEEKVNPLGGCLPILVQIPIFIALYWVLIESVELRQAPFMLWIDNLSVRDPYFILPALNAIFMIATQRLTPMAGMDPVQQKMMQAMPIVFSVMFAFFPAGLVLYWATNAGLSLAQQWYITRKIANE